MVQGGKAFNILPAFPIYLYKPVKFINIVFYVYRIENSNSLANDKVDKGVYESVREKLTNLTEKKPAPQFSKQMPGKIFP